MQDDKKAHQITLQELGIIPKEPCFTCDYCKHYDGKGTDRRLQDCDKYIVTDEHARRLRRHMKIINRRKAHQ